MYIPPQSVLHGLLCLVAFHIQRGRYLLILVAGFRGLFGDVCGCVRGTSAENIACESSC